jgi:hypothetical protein
MGQVESLQGKKAAFLITEAFPFAFLGGNQAVRWLKKHCSKKGAIIIGSGIVNWMRPTREKQIGEVVERLSGLF